MRWIINALVLCGYLCQLFEISTSFNLPIHLIKPNSANIRFSYDYSSKKNDLTCLMTHKYGEEIDISSTKSDSEKPEKSSIPSPLNNIVDVNIHRQSIIYEVELSREHGIEIVEGNNFAAVGEVVLHGISSMLTSRHS